MVKHGQPKRFRKGNLATVEPPPPYSKNVPEVLAVWENPPTTKGPKVVALLDKNDIILIIGTKTLFKKVQYSRIFSPSKNITGWVNSKFLKNA